ncbi:MULTISPECIES: hypothetical protein [Tsukamurella]|uniref:Uncharacterized protein n=1 Tax=Tsukamurella asaccharolytica TaxID=2592067 RepID=A0A5C5R3R4_9ACTN|nr:MULTISPECIES: hypothetical protein [Tsukamurella]TWS17770.1 hypothetical protein FK529_18935 [Tsukamurella asaccharolytica]
MSTQELVSFHDGIISYGTPVLEATKAVTPILRSAGSLITRISACSVEIKAIRMQAERLERRHQMADELLVQRAKQLVNHFDELERQSAQESIRLSQIDLAMSGLSTRIIDPSRSVEEIRVLTEMLDLLLGRSLEFVALANDRIIHLSDAISIESTARAIRMLDL